MRTLFAFLALLVLTGTAFSQALPLHAEPQTRIETDNETQVIRFIVNGKEVGRLTERGLEVENSIVYGGTITDRGLIPMTSEDGEVSDAP